MFAQNARRSFAVVSKKPFVCRMCLRKAGKSQLTAASPRAQNALRFFETDSQPPPSQPPPPADDSPFRKVLKEAAKQEKKEAAFRIVSKPSTKDTYARLAKWELTVGIEVHAELNTERKLFSSATTSIGEAPNTHVALFDTAFPGSQPSFQKETLIPALRAALAFNCEIQRKSSFDRKHYFYQDQPAGYQITQYYEPFAKNGLLTLYPHDFPAGTVDRSEPIMIGIKQIQMEQDTAKTIQQPPSTHLLDFNRVSHPLIEIITLPQIHDPLVAAVAVRKIQSILKSVNACTTGMELGGLRADVNVSVRERGRALSADDYSYHGVTGLGQRTEIKNLASVKAVEDAVIAERDRQIEVLENGGVIEGETRGWTLGSKTTTRLRGKEGEVDYRYMPDPDISPVIIGEDLIEHLQKTLPDLPDTMLSLLTKDYGLSQKDAATLLTLDNGDRLDYFMKLAELAMREIEFSEPEIKLKDVGKLAGNWVLMELGALFKDVPFDTKRIPVSFLTSTIARVRAKRITTRSARRMVSLKFEGDTRSASRMIQEEDLTLKPISRAEYLALAQALLDKKPDMVADIVEKGQQKKIMWFVGAMVAGNPEGTVEPKVAEETIKELLGLSEARW